MTQAQLSNLSFQAIKARGFTNGDYTEDRDLEDVWEIGFLVAMKSVKKLIGESPEHADRDELMDIVMGIQTLYQDLLSTT